MGNFMTVQKALDNIERLETADELTHSGRLYLRSRYGQLSAYAQLSVFDWFGKDYVTKTDLRNMRTFLNTAQSLGFNGYCCFKVGDGCSANGMWAYKEESTTGYSPNGDYLYRSFTPEYTCWALHMGECDYPNYDEPYDSIKTIKALKEKYYSAREEMKE